MIRENASNINRWSQRDRSTVKEKLLKVMQVQVRKYWGFIPIKIPEAFHMVAFLKVM